MAHEFSASAKSSSRVPSMTAALLILTSLVETLAIAHHPHVHEPDRLRATLAIHAAAHLSGWIHGVAIGCCLVIAYCLGEILLKQIPARLVRAAALVYAGGISALNTAATVDGWVIGRLAAGLPHEMPADLESNARLFTLCGTWVQASTSVGIVLTSIGILIASAGLLCHRGTWRIAGASGTLVGAVLSLSILSGNLPMDGHGALVVVCAQGAWFILLGIVSLKNSAAALSSQSAA